MLYNPSETWVDISKQYDKKQQDKKRHVNFITESGQLELYLSASASKDKINTPPKKLSNILARISGFP